MGIEKKMLETTYEIQEYLNEGLADLKDERYYNRQYSRMLIKVIVQLQLLNKKEELKEWLEKTQLYYEHYSPLEDDELSQSLLYKLAFWRFILSVVKENIDTAAIIEYAEVLENKYSKGKITKERLMLYEELILVLIMAQRYDIALQYAEKTLKIHNKGLILHMYEYLIQKRNGDNTEKFIASCKKILKSRVKDLSNGNIDNFVYFYYYFFELKNEQDPVKVFRALYYGIEE